MPQPLARPTRIRIPNPRMIITTAGATALHDAATHTDRWGIAAIGVPGPDYPDGFRERFYRERVGRWPTPEPHDAHDPIPPGACWCGRTHPPKCHNRPWHPVTWHPGKGVAAAGWMCNQCGEYL